jgi:hypothetical protein
MKTLLSNIYLFYSFATKDLRKILHEIENMETYKDRKECAEKNLEHLSSGSSRIVYKSLDGTIIKLAKNDKGIAQNKAEANPKMKSNFLNEIIDKADNYSWIETHYLDKITPKDFEDMTGLDFDDFGKAIRYGLKDVADGSNEKPKHFEDVEKSEIYKEMKKIGEKFKLMPGDIARISSWGTRNGKPVLIDAGLTKEVYDKFYDSES